MTTEIIKKYKSKTIKQLKAKATLVFNKFIRNRDAENGCISCNSYTFSDAGHFYSGGEFPNLKYNENNVHGQCRQCNHFKSANLIEYRIRLEKKIGAERLAELDFLAKRYKQIGYKWDRFFLIEIIEKYK